MDEKIRTILERCQPESNDFLAWFDTYGPMNIVDPDDFDLSEFDPHLIWTESWRVKRLITCGYESAEVSYRAITSYYIASNPWKDDLYLQEILAEGYAPCSNCDAENPVESCSECEGQGNYLIDFCELVF